LDKLGHNTCLSPLFFPAYSSAFLSAMARKAAAAGISRSVVDSAFAGLTPDGAVVAFDRRQRDTSLKLG
jgi:membrane-bound lytic murein transglycosylase B